MSKRISGKKININAECAKKEITKERLAEYLRISQPTLKERKEFMKQKQKITLLSITALTLKWKTKRHIPLK